MRATITIDDELLATAREMTGIVDIHELVQAALLCLLEREEARRQWNLTGKYPKPNP